MADNGITFMSENLINQGIP